MPEALKHTQAIGLGLSLTLLWLLLSGIYTPLLLGLGTVSVLLTTLIALRMNVVDREGQPFHLGIWKLAAYWLWLIREIIKADIAVCRIIVNPSLPIHPMLIRCRLSQTSNLGRVLYANSITLTPGTVTVDVDAEHGEIEVHTLTRDTAEALTEGEMDRRVSLVERSD